MDKRIINEFIQLVKLAAPSKNERKVADYVIKKLSNLGYEIYEDEAGKAIDGNTGNIICKINGDPSLDKIMLMAHMDCVLPCEGIKPIIGEVYIESDKTTILGSDDLSGVAVMLEIATSRANNEINAGDIYLVFTVSEEIGLLGAKELDLSKIDVDYAYVLDSGGEIGTASISAPSHITFNITITGKAAHAGMEPENGINAIVVASKAIAKMTIGRIDEETTCNIGIIKGGLARNIVCESVFIEGEVRSRDENKLKNTYETIIKIFKETAKENEATIEIEMIREYSSFLIEEDAAVLLKFKKACEVAKMPFTTEHGGGGSDTNIVCTKGIKALNISTGMEKVHSVNERIKIDDLYKTAYLLKNIVSLP